MENQEYPNNLFQAWDLSTPLGRKTTSVDVKMAVIQGLNYSIRSIDRNISYLEKDKQDLKDDIARLKSEFRASE